MAQSEDILIRVLENIATEENFDRYEIKTTPLTTDGANYTSAIYKAKISGNNRGDLNLFAKVAILSDAMREHMQANRMFDMERFLYTDLASRYEHLQEKYEIPKDHRFKFPKFYGSNSNHKEETIVLEDLVAEGYTMFDRFKSVNWDYASKAVEELAKLHALWFSYKHEFPEEHENNLSLFEMNMEASLEDALQSFAKMATAAHAAAPEHLKERLKKFTDSQITQEAFKKYYKSGKYAVLVHGDYRASNILYRRRGGKVKNLVPVDYQTMRLSSPATDLLYFIYCGTDFEFRRLYHKQLLDHYYKNMSRFLQQLHLDPNQLYSRKDFDDDYKDMLPYGLYIAIFILPLVMVEPQNAPDVSAEGVGIENFAVGASNSYMKRFNEIINEYAKLNSVI